VLEVTEIIQMDSLVKLDQILFSLLSHQLVAEEEDLILLMDKQVALEAAEELKMVQ